MLQPGAQLGEFRIDRVLREGGMGTVYVATQQSTGRQRALKVLKPTFVQDASYVSRFVAEARVGSQIASEHIVEVVSAGVDPATQTPYLAMELLEGQSLDELVAARGPLPAAEVVQLFEQTCHGLGAAHRAGVIHRDLKPENLFVASTRRVGAPFVVKLLDFGIAKLTQEAMTASGSQAIGTPYWMAPEQARLDAPINAATDVWALGLIAFFALSGRAYWRCAQPGQPSSAAHFLQESLTQAIEPPSARLRALGSQVVLPGAFDAWFMRCVALDGTARFPDAASCLEGLQAALSPAHQPTATAGTMVLAAGQLASSVPGLAAYGSAATAAQPMHQPASMPGTAPAGSFGSQPGSAPNPYAPTPLAHGSHPGAHNSSPGTYPSAAGGAYPSAPGAHPSGAGPVYSSARGVVGPAYSSAPGMASSFPGAGAPVHFPKQAPNRTGLFVGLGVLALLFVFGAGAIGLALVFSGGGDDEEATEGGRSPDETYATALAACRSAISAPDGAQALAEANRALGVRPGDAEATACRDQANRLSAEQRAFDSGSASLASGDYQAAYTSFGQLPPTSPFAARPEIGQAANGLAQQQLSAAQSALRDDPALAFVHAGHVRRIHGVGAAMLAQSAQISDRAGRAAGQVYEGRIVRATGVAPTALCVVAVRPQRNPPFNCRFRIRCDGQTVYGQGTSGWNRCARSGRTIRRARDSGMTAADGDPEMSFDLATRQASVRDRNLEVVMQLVDPAAPTQR